MNNKRSLFTIVVSLLLVAFFAAGCSSSSNEGDKFIMGGTYRLGPNEKIDGDLSIFGGAVRLEDGSTVDGKVILIGGTVNAAGIINGGIDGLGGSITLDDTAIVYGDITTVGASVYKSDSAIVQGKVTSQSENGVQLPDVPKMVQPDILNPLGDVMGVLSQSLVFALLAVLVVLFLPGQTMNVSGSIEDSPVSAGAIGLLTTILAPFVILLLAITIILSPIAILAVVVAFIGFLFGWFAVGLMLGERLAELFKAQWAPAVNAGIGTFVLTLVTGLFNLIPCVGWIVSYMVALLALGGIVMSAFGTRIISKKSSGASGPSVTVINPTPGPASGSPAKSQPVVDSSFVEKVIDPQPEAESTQTGEEIPPTSERRSVLKNRKSKSDPETGQESN